MDFYDRLIDDLLACGIKPLIAAPDPALRSGARPFLEMRLTSPHINIH